MGVIIRNNKDVNVIPGLYRGLVTDVKVKDYKKVKARRNRTDESQSMMVRVCMNSIKEVYIGDGKWAEIATMHPYVMEHYRKTGGWGVDKKTLKCMADICIIRRDGKPCFRGIQEMLYVFGLQLSNTSKDLRKFDFKAAIMTGEPKEVEVTVYTQTFLKDKTLYGDIYVPDSLPTIETVA